MAYLFLWKAGELMSFTSEYFKISGISSSDIGVNGCLLIRTDSSEINRQFMGNKNIVEENIPYKDLSCFYRTSKSPIEFDLKFSLLDKEFTQDRLFEMGLIFAQDKYIPFSSMDYPSINFYVIATSMSLITYGSFQGYIQVHLRTSAPYGFLNEEIKTIDCTNATSLSPITFEIECKSNVQNAYGKYEYYPYLLIDLKNNSNGIQLRNISNGNYLFGFENLQVNESIEVDNQLKHITSNTGLSRLGNMLNNHQWLYLGYGKNIFQCYNSCKLQFQCQYPIYL
jgi:hypothetical protein